MKVVFLEDVPGVANGGEIKNVKLGFARNYLLPKNLATPATAESLQRISSLKKKSDETRSLLTKNMNELSEKLSGQKISIEARSGANGKLFGSVTDAMIASELNNNFGCKLDRKSIQISESIREVGIQEIPINLFQDIHTTINLIVHPVGTDPSEIEKMVAEKQTKENQPEDPDINPSSDQD
ncbi:MAG: 50S ribosomal protein L9 [SAR202 cluster bacterium]|nr:50S ribosomal protein L9 [SAR202 cluster bacterium]|tara:strand:- start:28253 stop:28798 length:546 start_codon:yes stop_codon:yes gene_type:complete